MKTLNLKTLLTATAAAACTCFVAGQPVQAFGFTKLNTDWRVVQDSFNDGTQGGIVGSQSDFEIFGMAAKVDNGQAYFAFNGNLGLEGKNGIYYGDVFFNFSDMSFKNASSAGKLFAVHFADNDADLKYGVYENVTAKGVAKDNSGHDGFGNYQKRVETQRKDTTPGVAEGSHGIVGFGDLTPEETLKYLAEETQMKDIRKKVYYQETYMKSVKKRVPYQETYMKKVKRNRQWVWEERTRTRYKHVWVEEEATRTRSKWVTESVPETKIYDKKYSIQNVIASGDWMDDIAMLTEDELTGLDFGTNDPTIYSKAQTIGFKFDLDNLPTGDALISILHECINDGMAMKANFAASPPGFGVEVPEPTSIVSLGLIGLALAGGTLRKKS